MEHGSAALKPSQSQLRELLVEDRDGPLHVVNILRFHSIAVYPEGHALANQSLTGKEAYAHYGAVVLQQVIASGGNLVSLNKVEQSVIGDGASPPRCRAV
jgi:hypothetical protein